MVLETGLTWLTQASGKLAETSPPPTHMCKPTTPLVAGNTGPEDKTDALSSALACMTSTIAVNPVKKSLEYRDPSPYPSLPNPHALEPLPPTPTCIFNIPLDSIWFNHSQLRSVDSIGLNPIQLDLIGPNQVSGIKYQVPGIMRFLGRLLFQALSQELFPWAPWFPGPREGP